MVNQRQVIPFEKMSVGLGSQNVKSASGNQK